MSQGPGLETAWQALLAAAAGDRARAAGFGLVCGAETGWRDEAVRDAASADLIALYLPFIQPFSGATAVRIIGHLGQSLDGCIATASGDACFVTGAANIVHLHRMRALADAVIVGAGTVANDDPRLTTRLVPGPDAVRVVIDPNARLSGAYTVFSDGACPTLHCCRAACGAGAPPSGVQRLCVPDAGAEAAAAGLDLGVLCAQLRARGLRRLFVEGGGVTVSRFLQSGLLTRLQIAVAPVLIGRGRLGVSLPSVSCLSDALRPASRVFRMGADLLYDLDLSLVDDASQPVVTSDQTLARVR
jgi:riboflavin-specific deaminase-like protein